MSNATAAGPSRGILDILFGTGDAKEAEADGQDFSSLMNFIKSMNGEKKEEQSAVLSRTLGETSRGKGVAEGQADGMPGENAASEAQGQLALIRTQEDRDQKERLQELSALLGIPVAGMPQAQPMPGMKPVLVQPQEPLKAMSPEQVNVALKQKALPPLNEEEMKLLQAVNSKLEQGPPRQLAAVPVPAAAAVPAEQAALDPRFHQEMAKKGADPRKLKNAEASAAAVPLSGTPEKMVSTESYLQMHESVGKGPGKEAMGRAAAAANAEAPATASQAQSALTSAAVAGTGAKGLELGSRKEHEPELSDSMKQAKLDNAAGGTFGAALAQSSKEIAKHDVYLPGIDKPEQFREALLGDVSSNVTVHAQKGGGEMKLVLHPDDMGEVKLKVATKDGKVEVQLTAENNDVAKILKGGTRELEASLKEQNLSLAKFEVTVDTTSVASLDNKTSLNEQFLSQNQSQQQHNGFGASADDGRSNNRWDNNHGGRQGASYASVAEENGKGSSASARPVPKQAARDGSRRLDVVA